MLLCCVVLVLERHSVWEARVKEQEGETMNEIEDVSVTACRSTRVNE